MKFDYMSDLEDWAEENGYEDAWCVIDEKVLLQKRSSFVEFYLYKEETNTYARFTAYSDYDNGYFDIELDKEGLRKVEKKVLVTTHEYI